MSADSIPQISLGTAVLVIFLVCAGFVMLRGMARMLIGTAVLALSAWIGFLVWQQAPVLSVEWFGKSMGIITTGLPIAAFLCSFILIRKIGKMITKPFGENRDSEGHPPSLTRIAFRLLLALIPTAVICLIAAGFIHHTGSIAEVRSVSEKSPPENKPSHFSKNLKDSIERTLPESWLKFLDPLADPERLSLAKTIAARSNKPLAPAIDPETGQPIPRAIIVDDPDLQKLAREGKFGTLLRHPLLTKALKDPKVQALLKDHNL